MATVVKDLGAVSAYGYAVEKGYTGTEDEYADLMASYATVAQNAAASASQAEEAAQSVSDSAAQIAKNTADIERLNAGVNVLFDFHKQNLTWSEISTLVKGGEMSEIFPVASQIEDTWEATQSSYNVTFPWDVVHYANNGDMFLKWHYSPPEAVQFDAPEAIYYFDGTEQAGTYHILIGSDWGTGWVAGHSIQFTLTDAPDEGDQLFIDCGNKNTNPSNGRTWNVYAAGGTAAKQSGTTSEGTDGTSLGTIGNISVYRTNGRLNAIGRVVMGYSRWSQSAMRQYYNSDAAAGAWWTPQNPWDRPPTNASTIRGFLCGFSQDFLDNLKETEVVTALNTQEGFAETTETTTDRIFLPSLEQMYISPEVAGVEGESWDYYKDLAKDAGISDEFQKNQDYPALITYHALDTSVAATVFLRSCNQNASTSEWFVYTNGLTTFTGVGTQIWGCPVCVFHKS